MIKLSISLACMLLSTAAWAEKSVPTGLMLRATPEMRVVPKRGTRSAYVPPCKGVDATLVFAEWADMQPVEFGPIVENNVLDRALAAVGEWNRKHPDDQLVLRLRTFSGIYAPDWVMRHAGSVQVDYRKNGAARSVLRATPRFWTPAYQEAWRGFQEKMAAKYDGNSLICDVSISGSMTLHSEVMWRQPGFPHVLPALMGAGLTRENDLSCLKKDITLFMEIWKETPVEMTFSTRRKYILDNGVHKSQGPDVEFAQALLRHIASEGSRLNKRYMIGNHSLSNYSVLKHKKYEDRNHILHALMQEHEQHGTPLYFQTEVFTALVVEKLIREGIKMGACLIELPNDITQEQILEPRLQELRARMKTVNELDGPVCVFSAERDRVKGHRAVL